jgi:ubiquinone/menaquinone biosynthesis C-methylase UbiE
MTELVEEMQDYYALRAGNYDQSMGYHRDEIQQKMMPVACQLADQMSGKAVLEIACGPGFWTSFVSEKATSIVATDYNQSTLEQAEIKNFRSNNVTLKMADAYNLSLLGQQFQGCYAVDWFAHVPRSRISEFVQGLHGVLKPGASVSFCDQLPGRNSLTDLFDDEGNHLQERKLPDDSTFRVIKNYFSHEELHGIFDSCSRDLKMTEFADARRIIVNYIVK